MSTKYLVLFSVLLAIPVICLVGAVAYCCFKASLTAGIVSLVVLCLIVGTAAVAIISRAKKRK